MRTKVVVVIRDDLPLNVAVNAGAVVGLSLGRRVPGPLGADGVDASGNTHTGLDMHLVPVVTASERDMAVLEARARDRADVVVVGFTDVARRERTYEAYLRALEEVAAEDVGFIAVGLYGPREQVSALTRRLPLLGAS